jgi:hypothetical protein
MWFVITGGREASYDYRYDTLTTPRNKLLGDLAAFIYNGRPIVPEELEWYNELIKETEDFVPVQSESGIISLSPALSATNRTVVAVLVTRT